MDKKTLRNLVLEDPLWTGKCFMEEFRRLDSFSQEQVKKELLQKGIFSFDQLDKILQGGNNVANLEASPR